jgi:initiation factor 1A
MVKNANGGKNSKKMGRKFVSAPMNKKVRLALEEGEIYASVTKMLGNGMFNATCTEGKDRLVVMGGKFRGRGKRDNTVKTGSWVIIGEREFESCAKPKHDLLEVYTDNEIQQLKKSKDPIFAKLKTEQDLLGIQEDDSDVAFGTGGEGGDHEKYSDLVDIVNEIGEENPALKNGTDSSTAKPIVMDDGETVDVDDI